MTIVVGFSCPNSVGCTNRDPRLRRGGLSNSVAFGAALGAGFSTLFIGQINFANFWTGYSRRIGEGYIDKESGK